MGNDAENSKPTGPLTTDEAVELAAGVAELAKAGLPLAPGLNALADELRGRRLPGVLRAMAARLEAGESLDSIVEAQGSGFPAHLRGLITAGVRSGRLAEVLEELVDLERDRIALRRRVWLSMAYPMLLMAMLLALFLYVGLGLIDAMADVLGGFGAELPSNTLFMIWLAGPGKWAIAAVAGGFAAIGLLAWWASPWLPQGRQPFYYLPLVGPMWQCSRAARFSRLLSLLLRQGVALPKALRLMAADIGRGAGMARAANWLADEVESGHTLAESMAARKQFPRSLMPLVDWGERHSTLPEALRHAGELFEDQARARTVLLESITPPITFLIVISSVWFLLRAMYGPMISLIQKLT